jgi:hypothetical protein
MVRHYTTPLRWGREELDHGKVEQRQGVVRASVTVGAARELSFGSPRRSGGLAGGCGNPEHEAMRACRSRNGTVREVGAELRALLLSSLIRWTRRWPGLSVLARAGAGLVYWSSDSSAGRGAEHQRGVCALGWDGWVACGKRIACCAGANSRACCAVLGEFPRTLEMYRLRWIVLLYFELCKVQMYN